MKNQILSKLPKSFPWTAQIHCFECVDSTNSLAKTMAASGAPHGTIIVANGQTGGRGRMGRSFHSPSHMGIYMSVILRPQVQPTDLMHLTCATGVAVCNAIENTLAFRPGIKWANDLVYQKKKLGGILTELSLNAKTGMTDFAIIGIGINCNQAADDFPEDIREIATSLSAACGNLTEKSSLIANLLIALETMSNTLISQKSAIMENYRKDCITIGEEISVVSNDTVRHGEALSVDDEGALTVMFSEGYTEKVNTGEISIRGMYGYL